MAVRKVVIRECDRCGKKDELPVSDAPDDNAKQDVVLEITRNGVGVVRYGDLCERCDQRVNNVIEALKNARSTKDKKEGEN